ncbi:MAG: protein arginine kinase [Ruminococcus sp.]|nr:protein arginine kinase [Ruminococcus sp.]
MSKVVMQTRIRLARNLKKYPFPIRLNTAGKNKVCEDIINAVKNCNSPLSRELDVLYVKDLTEAQRISLVEQHLASPEFMSDSAGRALILSKDKTMSIMINEEDHIRLQILYKDLSLEQAYDTADKLDTLLDENLDFAFDKKLGYITQCPTNLGTGMRASVMLHLPALKSSKAIGRIAGNLSKLGLTIRGAYGEGTEPEGAMYQLSNQVTLGISEKAAIENLKNITQQLVSQELQAQKRMSESLETQDKICRSLGILRTAKLISCKEALELLSNVRFGINSGIIEGVDLETVDALFGEIQPATMIVNKNEKISPTQRDRLRAEMLNARLKG